jgi:hypothetical protein
MSFLWGLEEKCIRTGATLATGGFLHALVHYDGCFGLANTGTVSVLTCRSARDSVGCSLNTLKIVESRASVSQQNTLSN